MQSQLKTVTGLSAVALGALAFALSDGRGASMAQSESPLTPPSSRGRGAGVLAPEGVQNESAFVYQGQVRKNGAPVTANCNASFKLFDVVTGGTQIGGTVTSATLQVKGGLFTIPLGFGWGAFNGEARWLETSIGCGEAPVLLTPRTALAPAPYAFALPGMRTVPGNSDTMDRPTMNVIGGVITGTKENVIDAGSYDSVIAGGTFNAISRTSYYGAIGGGLDNLIVYNSLASVIGGGWDNLVGDGSSYSAIGGGRFNVISTTDSGAIGGGYNNIIMGTSLYDAINGGYNNVIDSSSASAIGGGFQNEIADSTYSAIGGGLYNEIANADSSFVGGGNSNDVVNSALSAIGGGASNVITSALFATIPGGSNNRVGGNYGLAAGRRAVALHDGSFVWGDSTNAGITSTAANQFIVRAGGGMGIGTNTPTATLHVSGTMRVSNAGSPGTSFTGLQLGNAVLGTSASQSALFTVTFPSAYSAAPFVIVTPQMTWPVLDVDDAFAVTLRVVTPSYFVVRVRRLDQASAWAGSVSLNWMAWR